MTDKNENDDHMFHEWNLIWFDFTRKKWTLVFLKRPLLSMSLVDCQLVRSAKTGMSILVSVAEMIIVYVTYEKNSSRTTRCSNHVTIGYDPSWITMCGQTIFTGTGMIYRCNDCKSIVEQIMSNTVARVIHHLVFTKCITSENVVYEGSNLVYTRFIVHVLSQNDLDIIEFKWIHK